MPMWLRALNPRTDLPRVVELMNQVDSLPITLEQAREWEASRNTGYLGQRMVATGEDGRILGFSDTGRHAWSPPGRFGLRVVVEPARRRQGIGTALYDDALAFALRHGATHLEASVADDCPEALAFATRRGFVVERHVWETVLDVARFDDSRFAGLHQKLQAEDIRFLTLAELGDDKAARRRLYDLNQLVARDQPGAAGIFPEFDEFARNVFDATWHRADCQFIAVAGEEWVGLAATAYFEELSQAVHNLMTGVRRDYRGRGIAKALKVCVIQQARRLGAATVHGTSDSRNVPMVAINHKLGYQAATGYYHLFNPLNAAPAAPVHLN